MPKLDRWLIASKMVTVLDGETVRAIMDMGGHIGGGWCEVHQHVLVNVKNKEKIEALLDAKGFTVSAVSDRRVVHPEAMTPVHAPGEGP